MSIHQMRKTYTLAGLQEQDVDSDPMVQFQKWFEEAGASDLIDDLPDWVEINAMTLSTSDIAGHVTSRIVLLKGIDDGQFTFYTNYASEKGEQLAANPFASLCFFWPHLQRQVCIEGEVRKATRSQSVDYFHSRPRESQLGANVSQQSKPIDAEELTSRMRELTKKYEGQQVPCPDHWGGYSLQPRQIEFWQGRPSRLHDRIVYRLGEDGWRIIRLAP